MTFSPQSIIGAWTSALQSLPLASQETCAAMELYHYQLKCRLLNERDSEAYQRADWLVDKLETKVHSYFWLDEYSGKDNFARYWKEEWVSGLTSFRTALSIPDSEVVISGMSAKITDECDGNKVHVVWNPGSQFGVCSCSWAEKGYIFSLAVSVEKQISTLSNLQKSDANLQKEAAYNEPSNGKSLDGSDKPEGHGEVATDLDGELSKMPMSCLRVCSENAEDIVSGSEMKINRSPLRLEGTS